MCVENRIVEARRTFDMKLGLGVLQNMSRLEAEDFFLFGRNMGKHGKHGETLVGIPFLKSIFISNLPYSKPLWNSDKYKRTTQF